MTKSQLMKATLLHIAAATVALAFASSAHAAVGNWQTSTGGMGATREALDLPMSERVAQLKQDPHSYENLRSLMFNKANTMDTRWKAVTAAGRVGGAKAKEDIVHALQAPEWFMRNAGLLAMSNIDRASTLAWARKLLSDKALVVRAAAVDVIEQAHDSSSTAVLWQKLYSKENFRNKQSLFIRRRIVEALADLEGRGHESKFVALLQDHDTSLHEPAMEALERLTKHTVGNPGEPETMRAAAWQKWYKENKASL